MDIGIIKLSNLDYAIAAYKYYKNKSNYEELKSLIESKEIASSFNASSSNSKKMRM